MHAFEPFRSRASRAWPDGADPAKQGDFARLASPRPKESRCLGSEPPLGRAMRPAWNGQIRDKLLVEGAIVLGGDQVQYLDQDVAPRRLGDRGRHTLA